ncbi:MAG: hypothetical protein IJ514_05385 [Clostridia bacterium]|nr:hypothetical protein [Clostridia bacterium]
MKRKIALLAALPFAFASFAFAGCKEEAKAPEQVVLCDFEQFEPDFQLMRLQHEFGAVRVNTDEKYVKSGKTSAKLMPIGGYTSGAVPYAYIQTFSDRFDYDYRDFTKVKSFSMWMYNAQETTEVVKFGLIGEITSTTSCVKVPCIQYALESGWNKVVVYLEHDKLAFSLDVADVPGLYVEFENAGVRDIEEAPVFYMDDVALNTLETPVEIDDDYEFAKGEIADFEYDYQANMITYQNTKDTSMPNAYVVKAANEGLIAPSGEKILKVVTKGDKERSGWPSILIPQKILEASGFNQIPKEQWANYVFRFEVYTEVEDIDFKLYSILYAQKGSQGKQTIKTKAGEWVTHEVAFSTVGYFDSNTTEEKLQTATENILTAPAKWAINWGGYNDAEEKVFYLDNFRYVNITEEGAQ